MNRCTVFAFTLLYGFVASLPLAAEPESTTELTPNAPEAALQDLTEDTEDSAASTDALPFVYTQWQHFTVADGLPSDHIFAVRADGDQVWVGTDEGLALIDKPSRKVVRVWREQDGLPWRVITGIDVDPTTGDVWLALFGKGLARLSGGRFDHFHQLNSGLVNDVVYAVTIENNHVWAATTAGASRYNTKTKEWAIYTEKNAPMEEIWNYGVAYDQPTDKVFLAVWGSGVLEFDCQRDREGTGEPWKVYIDPDHEMEIDLHRDDGIVHVITTGVSPVGEVFWVSTYFGCCRYDGRHWRGIYAHETGLPSDFTNNVRARSENECWFAHDKGLGVVADFPSDTCVTYTRDPETLRGQAQIFRAGQLLRTVTMENAVPHNFIIYVEHDGNDTWVGTGKGLGWAIGDGYYAGLRPASHTD